jgi:hypothetical protein
MPSTFYTPNHIGVVLEKIIEDKLTLWRMDLYCRDVDMVKI